MEAAIDRFYTADVFMHTWDLSRATGQDDRLDPGFCARLLGQMELMEQAIRSSGQYGAPVEVPGDADAQTRLLGFIGRDPFWSGRAEPWRVTPVLPGAYAICLTLRAIWDK